MVADGFINVGEKIEMYLEAFGATEVFLENKNG